MKSIFTLILLSLQFFSQSVFSKDDLVSRIDNSKPISAEASCTELVAGITEDDYAFAQQKLIYIIFRNHERISESSGSYSAAYAFFNDPLIAKYRKYGFEALTNCIFVQNFEKIYKQQADIFVERLIEHWENFDDSEKPRAYDLLEYMDNAIESINVLQSPDSYKPATQLYSYESIPEITYFILRKLSKEFNDDTVKQYLFLMRDLKKRLKNKLQITTKQIEASTPYENNITFKEETDPFQLDRSERVEVEFNENLEQMREYYKNKEYQKIRFVDYFSINNEMAEDFLNNYPISDENVADYNDYAFYLQKANNHVDAIKIIQQVIQHSPNRVVAYLNLADSFRIMEDDKKAQKHYANYFFLMQNAGKQNKIPQNLIVKYAELYEVVSDINKKTPIYEKTMVTHLLIGDLNKDSKDDYVVLMSDQYSYRAYNFLIYLSNEVSHEQVLNSKNVFGWNLLQEFSTLKKFNEAAPYNNFYISKNSIFYNEAHYRNSDTYQFIWRDNKFILAGLENIHESSNFYGETSINFLTQTVKTEAIAVEFTTLNEEPKEIETNETKKFSLYSPILLENFDTEYNSIWGRVYNEFYYELKIEWVRVTGNDVDEGFFTLNFLNFNNTHKLHSGAELRLVLTNEKTETDVIFLETIDIKADTDLIYDNYGTGKKVLLLPDDLPKGVYSYKIILSHEDFTDVISNEITFKFPF